MKNRLKSLNTIPFIVCLATLLLNDFYLKAEYRNWLTGKLSDFCGLFVFASFWTALFPDKKRLVYFLTALFFVIWKSPYSEPFIDSFGQSFYSIHRVVDITDLMALSILPVAFWYSTHPVKLRLNPIPLAVLSVISFCATSMPIAMQLFTQPQYILFKSGIVSFENSVRPSKYVVFELDSVVVIRIDEMKIDKRAEIEDEFHKKKILEEIDLRLLRESIKGYRTNKLSDYESLKDSLTVGGRTSITLKTDSIIDMLNFKNTRLDGSFKRLSNNDKLLIDGKFKNGIEDSIWTYYNSKSEAVSKKHFENGELTKTEVFQNSKLISEQRHNTRDETIRNKYFHLVIIGLAIIALLTKLILNYKRSGQKDIIQLSHFYRIAGTFGLPLVILILAKVVSSVVPNSYSSFFLGIFGEAIIVYIGTAPLLLLVFYYLKLRNKLDLVFYILLFSLSVVLIEEWIYLKSIVY